MPTTWDDGKRSSFLKETMCPKVYGTRGGTGKKDFILAKWFLPVHNVDTITRLLFVLSHLLAPQHYVDLKISLPNYALTTIDVDVTMSQNDNSEENSKEDPNEEKPNVSPKMEEPSRAEMSQTDYATIPRLLVFFTELSMILPGLSMTPLILNLNCRPQRRCALCELVPIDRGLKLRRVVYLFCRSRRRDYHVIIFFNASCIQNV